MGQRSTRDGAHAVRVEQAQPDEIEAMHRAEGEYAQVQTVRLEDLQRELELPAR